MDLKIKRKDYFIIAGIVSLLITFISYPGYFYYLDSYRRWEYALAILGGQGADVTNEYSLFPQIVMAICYKITENYAAYTFLQAFLFLFTTYCVLDMIVEKYKIIAIVLVTLCPPILIRGVQMEASAGAIIGINIFLLLLIGKDSVKVDGEKPSFKSSFEFVRYLFSLFLAGIIVFGYRQNALTIIPVIMVFLIKKYNGLKNLKYLCNIIVVLLSVVFVVYIPTIFGLSNRFDSSGIGVLWDNISVLEQIKDEGKYETYLDWLGGPGSTKEAIALNKQDNIYGFNEAIQAWTASDKNNASRLKEDFIYLCINEPVAVLKAKALRASYILGITQPLVDNDVHYDDIGIMKDYGMRDTSLRHLFMDNYQRFSDAFILMRMPWFAFLLATSICICFYRIMSEREKNIILLLYSLSVFYYGAFIVNAQSCEFRYYFPAFYLLIILAIYFSFYIFNRYSKIIKKEKKL